MVLVNRVRFSKIYLCHDSEVVVLFLQENELHNDENGEKIVSGVMRNRGCTRKPSGSHVLIKIFMKASSKQQCV